jgi:hypothetical protein
MPDPRAEQTPSATDAPGSPRAAPLGCARAAGMTCGVLVCLFGVLVVTFMIAARRPLGPVIAKWQNVLFECPSQLQGDTGLQGALQRYRFREGEYPARLLDLYPTYVSHRQAFHCPADPSGPETVSYEYRRPAADAPPSTVILVCDHHDVPGAHVRILVPIEGNLRQETMQARRHREP